MKVVCLASGGIDSSVLMFMLQKANHEVLPIHVNYGQKAEKMELQSATKVCEFLKLPLEVCNISGSGMMITSGLTNPSISASINPFFPARNLLFLTIAASYAYTKSIRVVSIGILANPTFPDQTIEFIKNSETTLSEAVGTTMKILVPFITLNKYEVVELAKKYNFPLGMTYSCYEGSEQPCNSCSSCTERKKVMNLNT